MIMRSLSAVGAAVLLVTLATGPAWAQSAANVLLVVNEASPESGEIGNYYAAARQIRPIRSSRFPPQSPIRSPVPRSTQTSRLR
jgi:hypothetical protein